MPVLNRAGVLGIFLRPTPGQALRVGTLVRDASGAMTFDVDETYIELGPKRPSSVSPGEARLTKFRCNVCG